MMKLWATIVLIFLCPLLALASPCDKPVARVVSAQGSIQALKKGENQWRPVKRNDTYCPGDVIRVQRYGRADILLTNETLLRLDQNTTVTFAEPEEEGISLISLLRGAAYFFSRVRRGLKVHTPYVNAGVEGTEFYVSVESDRTLMTIFEGRVAATNQAGSLTLGKGESLIAEAGRPPVLHTVVRPRDAVQWTLYYLPTLYFRAAEFAVGAPSGWRGMVLKSLEAYERDDLEGALEAVTEEGEEVRDPRFYAYRASLLLSVGRADEARLDIEKGLALAPGNSEVLALQSVIAVARNEKETALDLGRKAVSADPRSGSARIALSYALQAGFDLRGALECLMEAVKVAPDNALVWARLAEMRLSFGDVDKALKAAKEGVALNPGLSRTETVLGFAFLTRIEIKKSKEAFQKAMELDQGDPLPRLGLGLATIREGDLQGGRAEIEIAASLDPGNSLIRSYLGKAYYEEKRDRLSENQFVMAKELDPLDPTPYFYDAIRKQSINRPVEALYDLQEAMRLNDNRAVYRSRLLLDSDLAARSASLARIYNDLGFQQRALVEGWKSVNADPADFSGHRFLADSYSALPRHEIARASELLQSQLLQPININPVQPLLAETKLAVFGGGGPSLPSFNEYNPLFNQNRFALQTNVAVWGQIGLAEEVVQSGVWNRLSYSASQFYMYGKGENSDFRSTMYDMFAQYSLSEKTSIQGELRTLKTGFDDRDLKFPANYYMPQDYWIRVSGGTNFAQWSSRLGVHHVFSPGSDLIGSFAYQDYRSRTRDAQGPDPIAPFPIVSDEHRNENSYVGEVQYQFRREHFNVVAGIGHLVVDDNFPTYYKIPGDRVTLLFLYNLSSHHENLYVYSRTNYPKNVTWTVGASGDYYRIHPVDLSTLQFNPKLGVTWEIFSGTTIRAALFRNFARPRNQTIEPTQVAGFNQFFDEPTGTKTWRHGVGIDQKISKGIYGGAEYSGTSLDVPSISYPDGTIQRYDWKEHTGRAYVYWAPHPWFGFSAEYLYEEYDRDLDSGDGLRHLRTHRFPLGMNFYHPSGFSAQWKMTYFDQKSDIQGETAETRGRFWVADAAISYRLPKRFGLITFGVQNLFDRSFQFREMGQVSPGPTTQPERLIYGKLSLSF